MRSSSVSSRSQSTTTSRSLSNASARGSNTNILGVTKGFDKCWSSKDFKSYAQRHPSESSSRPCTGGSSDRGRDGFRTEQRPNSSWSSRTDSTFSGSRTLSNSTVSLAGTVRHRTKSPTSRGQYDTAKTPSWKRNAGSGNY